MRICLLTHTFPRSVNDFAAPFMHGVAEGLQNAGNEVVVLTPFSPKFVRKDTDQSYKIITYKYIYPDFLHKIGYSGTLSDDKSLKPLALFLSPFMYFFGVIALIRVTRKYKIEIVNAHWILPNGFIASVAKILTKVPVVSTLPGSDVYMASKNKLFKLMARYSALRSDWITSNSPHLLNDLTNIVSSSKTEMKLFKNKQSSIIYGVDPNRFKSMKGKARYLRKKLSIPPKNLVITAVGRLVEKKGFRYLLQAMLDVVKKHENVTLIMVGDGDQKDELVSFTKDNSLTANILFAGWANYDRLIEYYNICDIFVLPSVRDEMGNLDDQSVSVVEAMSCAKPVVTSDFPGYRLVIENGKNGLLVKEKDVDGLGKALVSLLNSKIKRNTIGKNARRSIIDKFSWESVGKEYTKLFTTIVNKN